MDWLIKHCSERKQIELSPYYHISLADRPVCLSMTDTLAAGPGERVAIPCRY